MDFLRFHRNLHCLFIFFSAVGALLGGCSEGVGDPCTPEFIPEGGYKSEDVYIEASSVQCQTRVCGVFRYEGDPFEDAKSQPARVEKNVYCTCRCRAPNKKFTTCECPDGFECSEDILKNANEALRGGYCVKPGTMVQL